MKTARWSSVLCGLSAGFLNGIFGAGGGVVVVPLLESQKLPPQKAHATSVAIILPLSIASVISMILQGIPVPWELLWWLLPSGLVGAWLGAKWLPKLNGIWLHRAFGALLIYSGIRLLFFR